LKKSELYPLKFNPILKEKIWGGNKLSKLLGKNSEANNIGESWEISNVKGNISIVNNGFLKGQSLEDILSIYGTEILGVKNFKKFGTQFPLLIKFIDAKEDLSIQLHPNDELAEKRHNSFGKTEMWHVMQADTEANLIVGFNKKITSKEYLKYLEEKRLTEILNFDKVKKGDTYFIEVGRVHAIGAGVMLAEIQQTSDITYRIYDWDRIDDNGNKRELHNDLAIDAINFNMQDDFKITYNSIENKSNKMVNCQYFTTKYIKLTSQVDKTNNFDSFVIYICTDGEVQINFTKGSETIKKGETVLLPACIKNYNLMSKNAELLEVHI